MGVPPRPHRTALTVDCIEAAARYLASEPAAVGRALREHRRGTDGHCVSCGCRGGVWPCAPWSSARRARSILVEGETEDAVGRL